MPEFDWVYGAAGAPVDSIAFKGLYRGPRVHLYRHSPYCYWCKQITTLALNGIGQPTHWTATVDHVYGRHNPVLTKLVLAHDACNQIRGHYTQWRVQGRSALQKRHWPHWWGPDEEGRCILCDQDADSTKHFRCVHCGDRRHQSKVCLQPLLRLLVALRAWEVNLKEGHEALQADGDAL